MSFIPIKESFIAIFFAFYCDKYLSRYLWCFGPFWPPIRLVYSVYFLVEYLDFPLPIRNSLNSDLYSGILGSDWGGVYYTLYFIIIAVYVCFIQICPLSFRLSLYMMKSRLFSHSSWIKSSLKIFCCYEMNGIIWIIC